MIARCVDVGDETIDEQIVIGQDLACIATEDRQVPQLLSQRHRLVQLGAEVRMEDVGLVGKMVEDRAAQVLELGVTLQAPLRQRGPADQHVQDQAGRWLEEDKQQPALRRFGRAAEWDDGEHRQPHDPLRGEEYVQPQCLIGQQCGHVKEPPVRFHGGRGAGKM